MKRNVTLTPKQRRAVFLLAAGRTDVRTAQELHCSRVTLWRWLKQEAFQAALREIMERDRQGFEGELFSLREKAMNELRLILNSTRPDGKPNTLMRMHGVKMVLDGLVRLTARYNEPQQLERSRPSSPCLIMPPGTRLMAGPPPPHILEARAERAAMLTKAKEEKVVDVVAPPGIGEL